MTRYSLVLLAVISLAACSKSSVEPTKPPVTKPVDNTLSLRTTSTGGQPGLKAYIQQTGSTKDVVTLAVAKGDGIVTKSTFEGKSITFGLGTDQVPTKSTGSTTLELMRGSAVLDRIVWDHQTPPAWNQAAQSAQIDKTIVLP